MSRRNALVVGIVVAFGVLSARAADSAHTFDLQIVKRHVTPANKVLRATQGERVELRWTSDEPLVLHLHGYDIETRVEPGKPAVTAFAARATGRFPVEIHGGRHAVLLHVEIHPR